GVPVPGRGYWARVAAGQARRQPKLKKHPGEVTEYTALTVDPPREESPIPARAEDTEHGELREKLKALQDDFSEDLRSSSPPIKRTATRLKRPWRNKINWNRGERRGPIVLIDVSEELADRALTIADRMIAGAANV